MYILLGCQIEITYPILSNGNGLQYNEVIAINERHYNNVLEELCLLLELCVNFLFSILRFFLIQSAFCSMQISKNI